MIYSIEGNVGSGKSTLVEYLKNSVGGVWVKGKKLVFIEEPVAKWQEIGEGGKDIIELFYEDQEKYSFSFQMLAYITRLGEIDAVVKENPDSIIISERCVYTDCNVFAKMLYDTGKIKSVEYQIYNLWFSYFEKNLKAHRLIYLDIPPSTCDERVKMRSRKGEDIPLEYLEMCDRYHREWLSGAGWDNILKLGEGESFAEMAEKVVDFII